MKDTVTKVKEKHEAEAKKMLRESMIICGTLIVLIVVIIFVGVRMS
jgi:heme/copper-type cytochrome/quinol oxidase subunit 2